MGWPMRTVRFASLFFAAVFVSSLIQSRLEIRLSKGFDDFPGNRRYVRDGFFREILFTVKPSALEAKGALDCFSEDFFKGLAFFQAAGLSIISPWRLRSWPYPYKQRYPYGAELYISFRAGRFSSVRRDANAFTRLTSVTITGSSGSTEKISRSISGVAAPASSDSNSSIV